MLLAVHAQSGPRVTLLLLMLTVIVSDSAQYYTGRMFGRRPLAPAISPKKTHGRAIGGVLFGTLSWSSCGRLVAHAVDAVCCAAARRARGRGWYLRGPVRVAAEARVGREGQLVA